MREGLEIGQSFSEIMKQLKFSDNIVTQLSLSESHGNLVLSLEKIKVYLENLSKVKKKLLEVASYPFMLFIFLILIMLGLRHYLLPQLENQNIATQIIGHIPQIFLFGSLFLCLFILIAYLYYKKSCKISLFSKISHFPLVGYLVKTYLTAYYAREWGNMIGQGLELSQILLMMQEQPSQLFRELGRDIELALQSGEEYADKVARYPFFKKELSLIIEYGEVKDKLGNELEVYAEKTWEDFFFRINRSMNFIQPLVFVFVALIIVLLYAAMLLPIYQNMEVHL